MRRTALSLWGLLAVGLAWVPVHADETGMFNSREDKAYAASAAGSRAVVDWQLRVWVADEASDREIEVVYPGQKVILWLSWQPMDQQRRATPNQVVGRAVTATIALDGAVEHTLTDSGAVEYQYLGQGGAGWSYTIPSNASSGRIDVTGRIRMEGVRNRHAVAQEQIYLR